MTRSAKSRAASRFEKPPQGEVLPSIDDDAWQLLDDAGLSQEIGFVMRMAQLAIFDDLSTRLKSLNLRLSQLTALRLIKVRPGLTQQRIGDALKIKKANLVPLIDILEEHGLVSRSLSNTDRRAYSLRLTAKGDRLLEKAMAAVATHLNATADILDDQERDRTIQSLRTIAQTLQRRQRLGASE